MNNWIPTRQSLPLANGTKKTSLPVEFMTYNGHHLIGLYKLDTDTWYCRTFTGFKKAPDGMSISKWRYVKEEEVGVGSLTGPGYIVLTKTGVRGRTYHSEGGVNGKVRVYPFEDGAAPMLCDPSGLEKVGFIV